MRKSKEAKGFSGLYHKIDTVEVDGATGSIEVTHLPDQESLGVSIRFPGIASYGLAWSVFPFQFGYFLAKYSPLVNDIEVIGTE